MQRPSIDSATGGEDAVHSGVGMLNFDIVFTNDSLGATLMIVFLLLLIIAILLFGAGAVLRVASPVLTLVLWVAGGFIAYVLVTAFFDNLSQNDKQFLMAVGIAGAALGGLYLMFRSSGVFSVDLTTPGTLDMSEQPAPPAPSKATAKLLAKYFAMKPSPEMRREAETYHRTGNVAALRKLIAFEKDKYTAPTPTEYLPAPKVKSQEDRNKEMMDAISRFRSGKMD